jgi:hypothetical protein
VPITLLEEEKRTAFRKTSKSVTTKIVQLRVQILEYYSLVGASQHIGCVRVIGGPTMSLDGSSLTKVGACYLLRTDLAFHNPIEQAPYRPLLYRFRTKIPSPTSFMRG